MKKTSLKLVAVQLGHYQNMLTLRSLLAKRVALVLVPPYDADYGVHIKVPAGAADLQLWK